MDKNNRINNFLIAIVAVVAVVGLILNFGGIDLPLGDGDSAIAGEAFRTASHSKLNIKSEASKTSSVEEFTYSMTIFIEPSLTSNVLKRATFNNLESASVGEVGTTLYFEDGSSQILPGDHALSSLTATEAKAVFDNFVEAKDSFLKLNRVTKMVESGPDGQMIFSEAFTNQFSDILGANGWPNLADTANLNSLIGEAYGTGYGNSIMTPLPSYMTDVDSMISDMFARSAVGIGGGNGYINGKVSNGDYTQWVSTDSNGNIVGGTDTILHEDGSTSSSSWTDKNGNGKYDPGEDDEKSAWDKFVDWLSGEGITAESEGGMMFSSSEFDNFMGSLMEEAIASQAQDLRDNYASYISGSMSKSEFETQFTTQLNNYAFEQGVSQNFNFNQVSIR